MGPVRSSPSSDRHVTGLVLLSVVGTVGRHIMLSERTGEPLYRTWFIDLEMMATAKLAALPRHALLKANCPESASCRSCDKDGEENNRILANAATSMRNMSFGRKELSIFNASNFSRFPVP
jgi:hypothetical protein